MHAVSRLEDVEAMAETADRAVAFLTEMEDADDTQELLDIMDALPIALQSAGTALDFLRGTCT